MNKYSHIPENVKVDIAVEPFYMTGTVRRNSTTNIIDRNEIYRYYSLHRDTLKTICNIWGDNWFVRSYKKSDVVYFNPEEDLDVAIYNSAESKLCEFNEGGETYNHESYGYPYYDVLQSDPRYIHMLCNESENIGIFIYCVLFSLYDSLRVTTNKNYTGLQAFFYNFVDLNTGLCITLGSKQGISKVYYHNNTYIDDKCSEYFDAYNINVDTYNFTANCKSLSTFDDLSTQSFNKHLNLITTYFNFENKSNEEYCVFLPYSYSSVYGIPNYHNAVISLTSGKAAFEFEIVSYLGRDLSRYINENINMCCIIPYSHHFRYCVDGFDYYSERKAIPIIAKCDLFLNICITLNTSNFLNKVITIDGKKFFMYRYTDNWNYTELPPLPSYGVYGCPYYPVYVIKLENEE